MTQTDRRTQGALDDALDAVANDLAGEFQLQRLLEKILRSAVELLGCTSGSLCLVDQASQTYRKEIDLEEGCQTGAVFPLDEGCTGAVVRAGEPVIFTSYSEIGKGHIDPQEPRFNRGVIGVPIRVRADLIGACIVFAAADERRFDATDAQLLQRFATHAAIAIANSRLHQEASERSKAAAIAAERERAMLEVHDSIGRGLAAVALRIGEAHAAVSRGEDPLVALTEAQQAAQETMNEGRRAVWGLGPAGLSGRTLDQTLELELEWVQATTGLTPTFRVFGDALPLGREVETQVVRIVQESLANAIQHAKASMLRLGLVYGADGIAVIVEDDGCGFDTAAVADKGVGLSGLVTRAAQVGGRVRIDSTPGWGTRIRADLPYRANLGGTGESPRLRVVIVHELPAMRAGLVRLLDASEPGVQVVAEVDDPAAAIEAVRLLRPQVVLAGTGIGAGSAAHWLSQLHRAAPGAAVIGIVDPGAPESELREWASFGVRGFVQSDVDATTLGRAVVGVARGDVLVFGDMLAQLGGAPIMDGERLTEREREVRRLVEQGLPDKQIVTRLGISAKTVEKHVSSILRKRGVRSRTELLARV